MVKVAPEVLELLEQVRQQALSYDEAEEYFPWGSRAFSRRLKGRNFLFTTERADHLEVMVWLPLETQQAALNLPFVERHKYMSDNGWVKAKVSTPEELAVVLPWIAVSYYLSKPVRAPSEVLPGEVPYVLDFLEQVRQVALTYENIEEYFPFGSRAFRSLKSQIFLYVNEGVDFLDVRVRLPLGEREYALSLPFVEVPAYIGHKGWVCAKIRTSDELATVLPWIAVSYDLNKPVRKGKARKQAELD